MRKGDLVPIEQLKTGDRFCFKKDYKSRVYSEVTRKKGMTTWYIRRGRLQRHFKPLTPVIFLRHVPKHKRKQLVNKGGK